MKTVLIAALLLLSACVPWGKQARHQALCGKATLQLYHNLQAQYFKTHDKYASMLFQLQSDPPMECREDWFYDMKLSEDGKGYIVSAEQRSAHETWTIDEKGFLRDPAETAARKGAAGQP
jgi:hypothetical protein